MKVTVVKARERYILSILRLKTSCLSVRFDQLLIFFSTFLASKEKGNKLFANTLFLKMQVHSKLSRFYWCWSQIFWKWYSRSNSERRVSNGFHQLFGWEPELTFNSFSLFWLVSFQKGQHIFSNKILTYFYTQSFKATLFLRPAEGFE